MLISPAYAQDAAGFMGAATQFLPLLLIFGVFYFLLIPAAADAGRRRRGRCWRLCAGVIAW